MQQKKINLNFICFFFTACRYEKGSWSDCVTGQMTRADKLKPTSDPSCEATRIIKKNCKPGKSKDKSAKEQRKNKDKGGFFLNFGFIENVVLEEVVVIGNRGSTTGSQDGFPWKGDQDKLSSSSLPYQDWLDRFFPYKGYVKNVCRKTFFLAKRKKFLLVQKN